MRYSGRLVSAVVALWCVLVLAGCATTFGDGRYYTHMQETLDITVRDNGSKQFTYHLRVPEGERPPLVRVQRGLGEPRVRGNPGVDPDRRAHERLESNTERALRLTGYCRNGYLRLDKRVSRFHLWLRGECRDGASAEDRERFAGREMLEVREASRRQ